MEKKKTGDKLISGKPKTGAKKVTAPKNKLDQMIDRGKRALTGYLKGTGKTGKFVKAKKR